LGAISLFGVVFLLFGLALTIGTCASAFWKGGREEQIVAGGLLMSWAVTIALRDRSWAGTQWSAFVADACLLVLLMAISMRTRRYWPLAAAAFQLLCVVTHVGRMIDPGVGGWAYATAQVIWSQLVFVALGVGVWNTWRAGRQPAIADDPITDPGATRR
jgi:uncharacterized membrane protein (UPF0136 family)